MCDPRIQCHADKVGARIFELEASAGRTLRVLSYDRESALEVADPELKRIRHEVTIDLSDDAEVECWCGAKGKVSELFDDTGLDTHCGGMGVLTCYCGGDLCVCHYHGETECFGCPDCEGLDDDDGEDYFE